MLTQSEKIIRYDESTFSHPVDGAFILQIFALLLQSLTRVTPQLGWTLPLNVVRYHEWEQTIRIEFLSSNNLNNIL
jgi:hypothetical protein